MVLAIFITCVVLLLLSAAAEEAPQEVRAKRIRDWASE